MGASANRHFTPSEELLRTGFRYLNRFMLFNWRLGVATWGNPSKYIGAIMVVTHTGRKSGLQRRTPLNYAIVDGNVYCTAAMGRYADWYRNVTANPQVEVWMPNGWWAGVATDVSDSSDRIHLLRQVLIGSGFAAYAAGIDPHNMNDSELDAATQDYRLICIDRQEARTGPGGPGDLSWVWPVSTLALLALLLRGRKK